MKEYKYVSDLHGHSHYSDGNLSPKEVVENAIKNKIDIVALTDHNSVSGLTEFDRAVKKASGEGQNIIGIPGIEVTTELGHVVFLFKNKEDAQSFARKGIEQHTVNDSKYLFNKSKDYDKYIILPHPEVPFAGAITFEGIDKVLNTYPDLAPFIGIEAINGLSLIMPPFMLNKHKKLSKLNKSKGWNRKLFANSDFHTPYGLGVAVTQLNSKVKINNASDFIDNIHNGMVEGNIIVNKKLSFPSKVRYFVDVLQSARKYKSKKEN